MIYKAPTSIKNQGAKLAACAHLTITVSEIERDICRKSSFIPHLHSTSPLGGFPSEQRHPVWYGKTRMAWLPDGEKNFEDIFSCFGATHERDRRTDRRTDRRMPAIAVLCIASHGKNRPIVMKFDIYYCRY